MWFGQTQGATTGQWWGDGQSATSIAAALSGQGTLAGTLTAVVADTPTAYRGSIHLPSWETLRNFDQQDEEEIMLILATLDRMGYL